jgi:hypothetical protein
MTSPEPFVEQSVSFIVWLGFSVQISRLIMSHREVAQSALHGLDLLLEVVGSGLRLCFGLLKPRLQLLKPLLVCLSFFGLMPCDCDANPMTAASNQHAEQRQSSAPQTSAAGNSENDAANSDGNSTPSSDALESLKMFFGHIRVQLSIMALSGFSIGYTVGKWRTEKLMRSMPPNDRDSLQTKRGER